MTTQRSFPEAGEPLPAVRADHQCFGCGASNPIGLHLRFTSTPDGVLASFMPLAEHQGFEGVVHGGIISTVLDEAMAWATAAAGIWAVTGEMRVRFRHPLAVGQATEVTGSIESSRGRIIAVASTLALADGTVIASAIGNYVRVDATTEAAWRARYLDSSP